MNMEIRPIRRVVIIGATLLLCMGGARAQSILFTTQYASVAINNRGAIVSVKDKGTGKEYCPRGMSSALMTIEVDGKMLAPEKAVYNAGMGELRLSYGNGSVARIRVQSKKQYLRWQLLSLSGNDRVDNVVWGPYKLTISKLIGDLLSVVRNDEFAVGLLGLDDNTTSGPPTDGDMSFMYYYIHSPDTVKYPLPSHLKEWQTFSIGGDGVNDVAFYSQPEEYFRMNYGNGASLEPLFGASICMHSRNRRREQMIRFPNYPENINGKANSARYQLVTPADAGYIGSSVALYACPDSLGLKTIERIVLNEGLPHPEIDGKWIKDPSAFVPDVAWWGSHDSLISYSERLGIRGIQDEGYGEYYPNPSNRWGARKIGFANGNSMTVPAYGTLMRQHGLRYGLHTLCEFLQPDNNSDVSPVPSDSLAIMQRTSITKDVGPGDTVITVADTAYFNEFGGWEGNHTNVLKIGKELIEYNGITRTAPYTFLRVKRGYHHTVPGAYKSGTTIVKLQPNCYRGFAPDIDLQDVYADYYGKWLTDGKMDYIDFDGLESCMYQGHGQYSFKRFFRHLFDSYSKNGGKYLRVMGSAVQEGNWHYMSVCNVGGGDHMFSPVLNKWGIEGKDMRYVLESSYFPATFGIQEFAGNWSLYDAENLEAKSIGWNATYMLGLSQRSVEVNPEKDTIFAAFRAWENARAAGIFTKKLKEKLKDLDFKFHLEQRGASAFNLYPVKEFRQTNINYQKDPVPVKVDNFFAAQPMDAAIRVHVSGKDSVAGIRIEVPGQKELVIEHVLSDGMYIICKGNELFVADGNRRKLAPVLERAHLMLPAGTSVFKIAALQEGDSRVKLELVVSVTGTPEKIGNLK